MASSNRHWPSMFKSKPTHHQWQQHEVNINPSLISSHRTTPYTPGSGCEERTPEPKPRWNPRPEQIRILESIFNSGMVNPPRDEIRKIRAQLQEYGQVGDANVFYWFQNRKSRSKHKLRHLQNNNKSNNNPQQTTNAATPPPITTNSSSSSSDNNKSSPNTNSNEKVLSGCSTTVIHDLLNSPTASVNQQQQTFFQTSSEFLNEPFYFPAVQHNSVGLGLGNSSGAVNLTQGFCFPEVAADQNCSSFLLSELMLMNNPKKDEEDHHEKMKLQQHLSYGVSTAPNTSQTMVAPSLCVPPPTNYMLQGLGEQGPTKSTVFINDVCFEVGVGPFNVREAFGDDAVLIQSTGLPVLTNEWGVTLEPLRHGAFYYLVRAFAPSPDERSTIDLI